MVVSVAAAVAIGRHRSLRKGESEGSIVDGKLAVRGEVVGYRRGVHACIFLADLDYGTALQISNVAVGRAVVLDFVGAQNSILLRPVYSITETGVSCYHSLPGSYVVHQLREKINPEALPERYLELKRTSLKLQ